MLLRCWKGERRGLLDTDECDFLLGHGRARSLLLQEVVVHLSCEKHNAFHGLGRVAVNEMGFIEHRTEACPRLEVGDSGRGGLRSKGLWIQLVDSER